MELHGVTWKSLKSHAEQLLKDMELQEKEGNDKMNIGKMVGKSPTVKGAYNSRLLDI